MRFSCQSARNHLYRRFCRIDGLEQEQVPSKNELRRSERLQYRGAQTKARTDIPERGFLGQPIRAKGLKHSARTVVSGMPTQNLWIFARRRNIKKPKTPKHRRLDPDD